MKKAMLFFVALLFSVSVSAATLNLTTQSSANATQFVSTISNNGPLAIGTGETPGTSWNSLFNLVSDVDTTVKVEWAFNPNDHVGLAKLGFGLASNWSATSLGLGFYQDVTGGFSATFNILAGVLYAVDFTTVTSDALSYSMSVSDVPVPAALFLFAPALLGFLGLRRKATLAA